MKAFQAFNLKEKKYLHQMPELFGGWSKAKGPKKMYTRAGDARGAVSNLTCWGSYGSHKGQFNPDEWEIHELEFHIVNRTPFAKEK